MKKRIILKITDPFSTADWVILSPTNEIISKGQDEKLSELTNKIDFKELETIILISSTDIVIRQIKLPKKIPYHKLPKLIPNILEEDIISNIESIHFSYLKPTPDGNMAVAIVSKDKLTKWLAILQETHITPDKIYPFCLAMKGSENKWQVWIENNLGTVKTGQEAGFTIDNPQLEKFLNYTYLNAQTKPEIINVSAPSALPPVFEKFPTLNKISQYYSSSVWDVCDKNLSTINLLQNFFSTPQYFKKYQKLFLALIAPFIFIFLLAIILEIKNIITLKNETTNVEDQISQITSSLYPHDHDINPRLKFENELKTSSYTAGDFYNQLFLVGKSLNMNQMITLKNLSYRNNTLTITIEAPNYHDIEKFIAQMEQSKLTVHQTKTEQQVNKLSALLTITQSNKK